MWFKGLHLVKISKNWFLLQVTVLEVLSAEEDLLYGVGMDDSTEVNKNSMYSSVIIAKLWIHFSIKYNL